MPSAQREAAIDETIAESFPASDPPSWTLGVEPRAPESAPPPEPEPNRPADDRP